MEMINRHKDTLRGAMLILLLVAMAGPWSFDDDGTPPAEWCHKPNILLGNGSCVSLVYGVDIIFFMIGVFLSLIKQMFTEGITGRIREYIFMFLFVVLVLLLVQPIFSTLLLRYGEYRPRRRIYNRIAWVLAVVIADLWIALSYRFSGLGVELWGVWLYFGVAAGMLVVELSTLVAKSRPGSPGGFANLL